MMSGVRYHRRVKRKRITVWPAGAVPPAQLAERVSYVGSAEHKSYPSEAGPPKLRQTDASPCDPRYRTFEDPTRALREAVRARQTSDFVGEFPKYVWGVLDGQLYEARLVNHELGTYKGYRVEQPEEMPEDPAGLLSRIRHE
jgi:hypothetical protein